MHHVTPGLKSRLETLEKHADAGDPIGAVRRTEGHVHGARIRRAHLTILAPGNRFARIIYVPLTLQLIRCVSCFWPSMWICPSRGAIRFTSSSLPAPGVPWGMTSPFS